MRRRSLVLAATAAALCALAARTPSAAQDAPNPPRQPTVLVHDITGATHRLTDARLFAESVGLLSVSLEATDEFTLKLGAGTVRVPVRLIRSIEFGGGDKPGAWTTVTVTDRDGNTVSGIPEKPDKAEIRGDIAGARFAQLELALNSVNKIVFEGAAPGRTCAKCKRTAQHPEWKFCPYDGQRLPTEDGK